MRTIWIFLCRLITFPWLSLGGYKYLSYLYRFFWQRKYKDVPIKVYESLGDIITLLNQGKAWRADSWRALGDAIGYPGRTQMVLSGEEPQPESDLDCDDIAIFVVAAIEKSRLARPNLFWENIQKAHLFTVTWLDGWMITGHNVALLEFSTPDGVKYAYMDYGAPSRLCNNISEVADLVRVKYCKKTPDAIVWSVSDLRLKPWLTQWGSPS